MYRVIIVLLIFAGGLYARQNTSTAEELLPDSAGVCPISGLLIGETLSPSTGMFIILADNETPQNWIYVPLEKQNYL